METGRERQWELLTTAAGVFLVANLVHGADHVRQDFAGFTWAVMLGGALLTFQAVVVFVYARRRHPHTAMLATVVGFSAAVLVAAAHIAPHWSVLSDSYTNQISADALSWGVMLAEVVAGVALGWVGLIAWLSSRESPPASAPPRTPSPGSSSAG